MFVDSVPSATAARRASLLHVSVEPFEVRRKFATLASVARLPESDWAMAEDVFAAISPASAIGSAIAYTSC